MFVLITYDVNITSPHGAKCLRNVARACMNYGKRVQNSVFECILTESQFITLRNQLDCGLTILVDHFKLYLYYELTQLLLICNSR